jgi:chalcone isomerase
MIRSIVLMDLPIDDIAEMERWYYRDHSSEISRRFGPWLERHESFVVVNAPEDARRYGFYNWRLTESWWREVPKAGPAGAYCFTPAPVWNPIVAVATQGQPDHDFLGWDGFATDRACVRWFMIFRYPLGVRLNEGEDWYVNVHAPEIMNQPGLRRFFTYKAVKPPVPLPGMWHPDATPPDELQLVQWDRVTELWYDSFSAWRNAVIDNPPQYTLPEWATDSFYPETIDTFPFFKPGVDFVSTFLLERPADEFKRDTRHYLP